MILVPIFNEKKAHVGAIGGTILVEDLMQKVMNIQVRNSGFALLVDEEDHIISKMLSAPDPENKAVFRPLSKKESNPGMRTLLREMHLASQGMTKITREGQNYQAYFQPLTQTPWRLALRYNEEEIFKVSRERRMISLILLSIALIVVFFITYGINFILITPIRYLIKAHRSTYSIFDEKIRRAPDLLLGCL